MTRAGYLSALVGKVPVYVPGEQPQDRRFIKLNTNENPYPPSPRVIRRLREAIVDRLNLYPDPTCRALRQAIAGRYGLREEEVCVGNGADEILRLAMTAFAGPGSIAVFPAASYPLYRTLAVLAGCRPVEIPVDRRWLPRKEECSRHRNAFLVMCNPNSPTGAWMPPSEVEAIVREHRRVVLIDEAYADFARDTCLSLVARYDNVVVCRTFSKAFALAGIRVGWCAAHPDLISALYAIRDSYPVDRLAQAAATAAVEDWRYMEKIRARIVATRKRLERRLARLGFTVAPSEANFVFARPPGVSARMVYDRLKERGILVRWFNAPTLRGYLRITVGTDTEIDALCAALRQVLGQKDSAYTR